MTKKWDQNCYKDFHEVAEDDLGTFWDTGLNYRDWAEDYLARPETLNKKFGDLIKPIMLAKPQRAGNFVERFLKRRLGLKASSRITDGEMDGKEYEIKTSTLGISATFRQVKFEAEVFLCVVIFEKTDFKLYKLTRDQMYKEMEDSGHSKTHNVTVGFYEEHAEYNVKYQPEWDDKYQIDSSFMNTVRTDEYPDLFDTKMVVFSCPEEAKI